MRVLLLTRQEWGGTRTWAQTLERVLPQCGVQARHVDASDWMPMATGMPHDRLVSRRLRSLAADYDLVHAFGYRCAWACAETFGNREAWAWSAHALPKTTHPNLVSRLNLAPSAIAHNHTVRGALEFAGVVCEHVVCPGAHVEGTATREAARSLLEVPPDQRLVVSLGRLGADPGFRDVMDTVGKWPGWLWLSGEPAPEDVPLDVRVLPPTSRRLELLRAADLVVVPQRNPGFSVTLAEAMRLGAACVVRSNSALLEMVEHGVSGHAYETVVGLASSLEDLLGAPDTRRALGEAARLRADERYEPVRQAGRIADLYRDVVS